MFKCILPNFRIFISYSTLAVNNKHFRILSLELLHFKLVHVVFKKNWHPLKQLQLSMLYLLAFHIIRTTETCSYKQVKNYKISLIAGICSSVWNKNGCNNQNSYSRGNRNRKEGPLLLANLAIIPKSELVFIMNIN